MSVFAVILIGSLCADISVSKMDENYGGIFWEQGALAPHQASSPGIQHQEDKSPQLLAAKPSRD